MGLLYELSRSVTMRTKDGVIGQLEDMGVDFLAGSIGGPIGVAIRSFFSQMEKIEGQYVRQEDKLDAKADRQARIRQKLEHEVWLEQNRWRFDWRSQPRQPAGRPEGGEWIEGRLDYPVGVKQKYSRAYKRNARRAIMAYRARRAELGETKFRPINTSWGQM